MKMKKSAVAKADKKKNEHIANVAFVNIEIVAANKSSLLNDYDVLCHNQSTINLFKNKYLLSNIRQVEEGVTVNGVGGSLDLNMVGDLPGFGTVYYHPSCVANILCFHDLAIKKLVRYDDENNKFIVSMNGKEYEFIPKGKLYVYNSRNNKRNYEELTSEITLIQNVKENEKMFTERERKNAALARQAQLRMGYPSIKDIVDGINKGRVINLPISRSDLENAEQIWGKDMGSVVGKTTRTRPSPVIIQPTQVSMDKNIILCADIFYIGGLTFLLTVSRGLSMCMVSHMANRKVSTLKDLIMVQVSAYQSNGFLISYLLSDNESAVTACIPFLNEKGIKVNQTSKNEHVPEVERAGRTLKERVRAVWNTLPYKLTDTMVIQLTYYACMMINMFPKKNSIGGIAPRELFTGVRVDYKRDCKLGFGEYVQVYAENDITNTMEARTYGAISLGSAGNLQGTYLFMSLTSWKIIRRRSWVEMPMPAEVIELINRQALKTSNITSESEIKIGNITLNDDIIDEYEPYIPDNREEELRDDIPDYDPNADLSDDETNGLNDTIIYDDLPGGISNSQNNDGPIQDDINGPDMNIDDEVFEPDYQQQQIINADNQIRGENNIDSTHRYNLRSARSDWRDRYSEEYTAHVVLTNLSIPKAIKLYGVEALASIMKEMNQLQDKGVWTPLKYENIKDKSKIIRSLLFLKRKRDGSLKARLVADGRMQDRSTSQDNSSPTVGTESLFLMVAIFAAEGRQVVTVDIEGAFLHGIMTSDIYMEIQGQCLDVLLHNYADIYTGYIRNDKVYVKLDRALYGTIEAARVWYNTLSTNLLSRGFKANAFDPCVFNKDFMGDQLTILLHVDDLMIACKNKKGIDYVIQALNSDYSKANVYEGSSIDYLGMIFNFSIPGEVSISMGNMVSEFLQELAIPDDARAESPAASYLYDVDESEANLDDENSKHLHSLVAKALYMAKRGRPDILTTVSFLTTRVKCPNQGDYKKLKRLGSYLNNTKDLKLILKANDPYTLYCFVDASYATHVDGKGRTGNVVTLGRGAFKISSTKHNIVTKSSTEAEIVVVSDAMGGNIGLMYLMEEQDYNVKPLILYQDN